MKKLRLISGLAAGLMLTACVPALKEQPQPIASIHIATQGGTGACCLAHAWWTLFGDEQLNQLVRTALADNPGLAEAQARVEAAEAEVSRADASRALHVDSNDKVTRLHNSQNGDRAIYNGKTYTLGDIEPLSVNYHLDLWGQDKELVAVASANAEVAKARRAQSELLLTAAVIKTWFAWQTSDQLVEKQQALVDLAEDASRIKAVAVKTGIAPDSEQVAQNVVRDAAQAKLSELTQRRAALRYALLALLGKAPEDAQAFASNDAPAPEKFPLPASIDLNALAARPDIQVALRSAQSAHHQQELAKTAYYPNINLHAFVGVTSIGLSDLFKSNSVGYAFGPAVSLPLFEGGALDANLHAHAASYDAAVYAYNKAVLAAAAAVATDLADLDNSKQNLADKTRSRDEADRLAAIADAGYRSGVSDRFSRVQAQIQQDNADMDYQSGKLSWLYAITDTATDLGGGIQQP